MPRRASPQFTRLVVELRVFPVFNLLLKIPSFFLTLIVPVPQQVRTLVPHRGITTIRTAPSLVKLSLPSIFDLLIHCHTTRTVTRTDTNHTTELTTPEHLILRTDSVVYFPP